MHPTHKPWHRTRWGFVIALIASPFWFVWKKSRRNRFLRTTFGGAIALVIFILLASFLSHVFSSKKPGNNAANSGLGSSATSDTGSSIALHGYGATLSDWNASHTADNGFTANTTYNPASGLGNGYTDKYTAVLWISGRALSYQIGFPSNTSLGDAKSAAIQEFPSDTTILWENQNNSDPVNICYQMEVHSATLGQVLQNNGDSFVEFQTVATNDTSNAVGYYANNVNNASLRNADYKKASDVGGC
jgi:hypothetical protein